MYFQFIAAQMLCGFVTYTARGAISFRTASKTVQFHAYLQKSNQMPDAQGQWTTGIHFAHAAEPMSAGLKLLNEYIRRLSDAPYTPQHTRQARSDAVLMERMLQAPS